VKRLVRKYAQESRVRLNDNLGPLSKFLCSDGDVERKRRELNSFNKGLKAFATEVRRQAAVVTRVCQEVVEFVDICLDQSNDYSYETKRRLTVLKSNILGLVDREVRIDHEVNATFDQRNFGIVKALAAFVPSTTYRDLLLSIERGDPTGTISDSERPETEKVKMNVLTTLMDVGRLLEEDFSDPQAQLAHFELLLDLYRCYADVLGKFVNACIKKPDRKWPIRIIDFCLNRSAEKHWQSSAGMATTSSQDEVASQASSDASEQEGTGTRRSRFVRVAEAFLPTTV